MSRRTHVTIAWLRKRGACSDQIATVEKEWGDSAEITLENLRRAAELELDLDWLAEHLLTGPQLRAYEKVTAEPMRVYREVTAEAMRVYREVTAEAMRVYLEVAAEAMRVYLEAAAEALWSAYAAEAQGVA